MCHVSTGWPSTRAGRATARLVGLEITVACGRCGHVFVYVKGGGRLRKACDGCQPGHLKPLYPKRDCAVCGDEFQPRRETQQACTGCKSEWDRRQSRKEYWAKAVEVLCGWCGKAHDHSPSSKLSPGGGDRGAYCTTSCSTLCMSHSKSGGRIEAGVYYCACGVVMDDITISSCPACYQDRRGGHRGRCEAYGVPFDGSVTAWQVFQRDGYRCQNCACGVVWGADNSSSVQATVDHVIPLSWGEVGHTWDNVQTFCRRCNSIKGNHWAGSGRGGRWARGGRLVS